MQKENTLNGAIEYYLNKGLTIDQLVLLLPIDFNSDKIESSLADENELIFPTDYGYIDIIKMKQIKNPQILERPNVVSVFEGRVKFRQDSAAKIEEKRLKKHLRNYD